MTMWDMPFNRLYSIYEKGDINLKIPVLLREKISVFVAKKPRRAVLLAIFAFNVVLILVAATIISSLSLDGTEHMSFIKAAFCTITMILDAGCIQFVVSDIGASGVLITIVCLALILIGMISFTGAIIGYFSNYIADFISNATSGTRKLNVSEHIVILNWNTRASEIINDLMYSEDKKTVVVLVKSGRESVEREIAERLSDTINRENKALQSENRRFARKYDEKVTVIVREGDVFSSKQLQDISLERARTVIILGDESIDDNCAYQRSERIGSGSRGNTQTVKTLMQVADITSSTSSFDSQKVVVEITDNWTWEIISRIKEYKQIDEKCNIVPIRVNKVLGQLLSQFSIMPELNVVYRELLSNKGVTFYYKESEKGDDNVLGFIKSHNRAIPLDYMEYDNKHLLYYAATSEDDYYSENVKDPGINIDLNCHYRMEPKHVIILGHNSKIEDIMEGFSAFSTEWSADSESEVIDVLVIDDEKSLESKEYYKKYPFVKKTVAAEIYDRELICGTINEYVDSHDEDTSILILSDDLVSGDETDSQALANLVYVQDIILQKKHKNPEFDENSIDLIVEIIDPKHHDIVNSYSVNNVVISNRFISKMITQIGEKDYLFDFYKDILTYDTDISDGFDSKEIYTKRVSKLMNRLPGKCSARELIYSVYQASIKNGEDNPTVVLGYISKITGVTLFGNNLDEFDVDLKDDDFLIVYSNH